MALLEDIPKYAFGTTHAIEAADQAGVVAVGAPLSQGANFNSGQIADDASHEAEPEQSTSSDTTIPNGGHIGGSGHAVTSPRNSIGELEFKELVLRAISLGCYHFDCAPLYGTQSLVGQALCEAMNFVPRQKLFITSKLPPNMMRSEHVARSLSNSIAELQCSYLDLYLIHAPFSTKYISDNDFYPTDTRGNLLLDEREHILENAWRTLADLKRQGFTRYIGLSNVNIEQIIRLNNIYHIDVVQNEYHIYNQDREIVDFCEELDIHFEAYAAMGSPELALRTNKPCVARDPVVQRIAAANKISVAAVSIQWIYQQPLSYVIRCDTPGQLEENLKATESELSLDELMILDELNRDVRLYPFDEHQGLREHREYPFKETETDEQKQIANIQQQAIRQHVSNQQQTIGNYSTSNHVYKADSASSNCSDALDSGVKSSSNTKTPSSSSSSSSAGTTIIDGISTAPQTGYSREVARMASVFDSSYVANVTGPRLRLPKDRDRLK